MRTHEPVTTLEGIDRQWCLNCEDLISEKFLMGTGLRYCCDCSYVHPDVIDQKLYHFLPASWVMVRVTVEKIVEE